MVLFKQCLGFIFLDVHYTSQLLAPHTVHNTKVYSLGLLTGYVGKICHHLVEVSVALFIHFNYSINLRVTIYSGQLSAVMR